MSDDLHRFALRTLMPGFDGVEVPAWLDRAIEDGVPSVCLYASNVVDGDQVAALTARLRRSSQSLLIATDEEGGDVTRLHYRTASPYVGNAVLGRLDDVDVTRAEARRIGDELRAAGIDLCLGPVVDVNSEDGNPVIGTRSFGADAALVARHGVAWVEGLQSSGVLGCAKHFPGHGDTRTDSHLSLPVVDAPLDVVRGRELAPFAAAVRADVACVMTAYVVVPALDPARAATFSPVLIQDVLRGELGFRGTVISDALDMAGASAETGVPEAAVRALIAGCDLLCLGPGTTPEQLGSIVAAVVAAVGSGRLPEQRLRDAAESVRRLQLRPTPVSPAPSGDAPHVVGAFTASERARAWLAAPGRAAALQVETATNPAVGSVPWGLAAAGCAVHADVEAATKLAVVGRGIGADHPAWELAERHRSAGRDVIVVECGWPRGGADVVTWGSSATAMRALVRMLGLEG